MNVQQMNLFFPPFHLLEQLYYYKNPTDTAYTPETTLLFFSLDLTGAHHMTYWLSTVCTDTAKQFCELHQKGF